MLKWLLVPFVVMGIFTGMVLRDVSTKPLMQDDILFLVIGHGVMIVLWAIAVIHAKRTGTFIKLDHPLALYGLPGAYLVTIAASFLYLKYGT